MEEFIKKWELILEQDLDKDIVYDRNVIIQILSELRQQVKNLTMHNVTNQRELLINFLTFYAGDEQSRLPDGLKEVIDIYLKN